MSTPEKRIKELDARLRQQRMRADLARLREPPGLVERGVGLARQGLAGIGDMIGTTTVGAMRSVGESPLLRPGLQDDLLEGRVTAPDEGGNVLTRGADILQGQYEDFREETAPEGMGETVARVGGRLVGEGAKYMFGGGAIRAAAGSTAPAAAATLRGRAAQGLGEAAKDALAVLPLDIATTAYGPEESTLGAIAELTGSERMAALAENRAARLAAEAGIGFGMDTAIRGVAGGVREGARAAREIGDVVGDLSPAIREGLEGADRPVIVPDRPVSDAPDVPAPEGRSSLRRLDEEADEVVAQHVGQPVSTPRVSRWGEDAPLTRFEYAEEPPEGSVLVEVPNDVNPFSNAMLERRPLLDDYPRIKYTLGGITGPAEDILRLADDFEAGIGSREFALARSRVKTWRQRANEALASAKPVEEVVAPTPRETVGIPAMGSIPRGNAAQVMDQRGRSIPRTSTPAPDAPAAAVPERGAVPPQRSAPEPTPEPRVEQGGVFDVPPARAEPEPVEQVVAKRRAARKKSAQASPERSEWRGRVRASEPEPGSVDAYITGKVGDAESWSPSPGEERRLLSRLRREDGWGTNQTRGGVRGGWWVEEASDGLVVTRGSGWEDPDSQALRMAAEPDAPSAPEPRQRQAQGLNPSVRLVGHADGLEGRRAIYEVRGKMYSVSEPVALDVDGVPMGLRSAPYALDAAARGDIEYMARTNFTHAGDTPASPEAGFLLPAVARTLTGAGLGAAAGAAVDDEKPLRGALLGGMVGAGAANIRAFGDSDLYRRVVDQTDPIAKFGRRLGGEAARNLLAVFRGWRGAAGDMIQRNLGAVIKATEVKDFVPAPVTEARNAVRGALSLKGLTRAQEEVTELLVAQRAIELAGRGITDKVPFSVEQARQVVAELQPRVGEMADALRAYYRELLDMRLRAGVISQADYDAITQANEFYTPFTRDFGDDALPQRGETGRDGRTLSGKKGVRRLEEGSATSPIMDPFTQAVEDTNETFRRVGKQRVTNLVAQLVEENPEAAAPFLRRVPNNAEASRNARIVQANVNGQRQSYEVIDDDLYEAWAGMDEYVGNLAIRILSVPRRVLRETVTILPDFAIANAIRDNMMSVVQYPLPVRGAATGAGLGAAVGAATAEEGERGAGALRGAAFGLGAGAVTPQIARMVRAMKNIIADDAVYREFVQNGGSGSGFYVRNTEDARRVVKDLRNSGFSATDVVNPRSWWNALQAINRVVEEAPRVARYKYGREVGESAAEAIFNARDISLDFARMGSDMKGWNAMVAFQNAKIQGYDKLARLANPKTAAAGIAAITAPSIALWTVNSEDPEYWNVPLWERNLFWLIPKSEDARARGEGAFWKIPKPFEVGFIFASLPERLLDFRHQQDPEALRAALADMTSTYGQMQGIPTAALPIIENVADYSFFRGRAINPEQYANIPAEFQFDNRTSSVAVAAGNQFGVSPAKVDNALRGYFGSLGNEVNRGLTALARRTGLDDRPDPPSGRMPLLGRFTTTATASGEMEQSVRRKFRQADAARTAVRRMIEDGDMEGARRYATERADVLRDYQRLKTFNDALGDVTRMRREIGNAEGLSASEKARRLAELNRRVSERLRQLNP